MRLKYFSFHFTLAAMLLAISALASTTRVRSMGDVGLIFRDQSNIWLFPSTMVRYRDLAILELGGRRELLYYLPDQAGFEPSGGGLIGFGANQQNVIGGFFGESSERLPFAPTDPNTGQPLTLSRRIDLFLGANKSRTSLGWQLTYASGAYEISSLVGGGNAINKGSVRAIGLAFGMTYFLTQYNNSVDVTLRYNNHRFDLTRSGRADEQPKDGHHFDLLGRWTKGLRQNVEIVPFVGLNFGRDGREVGINGQNDDRSQSRMLVGTGFNFRPDSNSVFSLGLSLLRTQEKQTTKIPNSTTKQTLSTFRLPFVFGGIETTLFNWLQARFGFQKALQTVSRKNESTSVSSQSASEDKRSEGPFELAFGLGVHYRNLTVDFSLDPDYFKRGVYVLSGSQGNMFNLATMTYAFK